MNTTYYETIHQIIRTGHWITDSLNKLLKDKGSTEPQYNVLRILHTSKEDIITLDYIKEGMVQPSSNVTRIVEKLLIKGYVTREECPTNRRKKDIKLTTQGVIYLKTLDEVVESFHSPMFDKLNSNELNNLKDLIKKYNN
ncbi:MAG: MarR family transcriptional regulator [Spirochaetaceae bacterium]